MPEKKRPKPTFRKQPSLLALIRHYFPPWVHRPIIQNYRQWVGLWSVNSGNWKWLKVKPIPLSVLSRKVWRSTEPSGSYFVLLFLSGIISAMGLLAGSTATIIGAMIVAPLMGPITGIAFALSLGNRRLLQRAGIAVVMGGLLTIGTAYFLALMIDLNTLNPEINARVRPTLIDLVIALAAGAAGSYAQTRRDVADALPGVAIAVALVPPLSVVGIGLALPSQSVALGSFVLFTTNLVGIIFSGVLVFIWQEYGSLSRAKRGLLVAAITVGALSIPLGLSFRELVLESKARSLVSTLIRRQTLTFKDADIRSLRVDVVGNSLVVNLEVAASAQTISQRQVSLVHGFIEETLERPIELNVRVIPVEAFNVPSSL